MKLTILLAALILSSSCSELKNNISKNKEITNTNVKIKKNITKKVAGPVQESTNHEITGTLKNGVEYEAGLIPEGYTVSLDPYIAKNDLVFSEVA
ncbi:MAG: hypothetical protein Q7U04_02175, partial [Bacteriovorax sp.]|nr:hypothetical protein [Bacteriovorax sp.]